MAAETVIGKGARVRGRISGSANLEIQGHVEGEILVDGDLTGQFITATCTRVFFVGFAKPEPDGVDQGFLTQTSELSRPMEVR